MFSLEGLNRIGFDNGEVGRIPFGFGISCQVSTCVVTCSFGVFPY